MRYTHPDHSILSVSKSMRLRLLAVCLLSGLAIFPVASHAQDVDLLEVLINAVTLGQKFTVEERSPDRELRISAVGSVVFNETDDDVLRLDGRLTIREKRAGVTRQIEFRQRDGMLRRTYKLNGREVELDADAKRWVAGIIKSTIREQAMDATRRIKRIHAKSGATGVLDEIDAIRNAYAKRIYIEGLVALAPLDEKSLLRALLATTAIKSDFEQRNAWIAIANTQILNPAQQVVALNAIGKLSSPFEQRSALEVLAPKLANDAAVALAWRDTVAKVSSDFEVRSVIESMTKRDPFTQTQINLALEATTGLKSDFERASALTAIIARATEMTPAQLGILLKSVGQIDSDFERRNVLTALTARTALDKSAYAGILDAVAAMKSDFEKGRVLEAVAKKLPADRELVQRYRTVARGMADFERGPAEKALDRLNM